MAILSNLKWSEKHQAGQLEFLAALAEALARWTRANGDAVPPDVFIRIAERSSLIVPITAWTLNAALRACGDYFARFPDFSVAVNLSPIALNDPENFDFVSQSASIWCTDKCQLTLEITEGALMVDPEAAIAILDKFHNDSIRLSIDDFGTGYSSLSQLGRLSVGELKIDKSFVLGVIHSERNAKIVRSIIDLAHNFHMTVVAEGIEDAATLQFSPNWAVTMARVITSADRCVSMCSRPGPLAWRVRRRILLE